MPGNCTRYPTPAALSGSSDCQIVEPDIRVECSKANIPFYPIVLIVSSTQIHRSIHGVAQVLAALGNRDVVGLSLAAVVGDVLINQLESGAGSSWGWPGSQRCHLQR